MQLGRLQGNFGRIQAAGGAIIAVSVDPPEKARELAGLFGLKYPLVQDADLAVVRAWGRERNEIGEPAAFVLDPKMVVVWSSIGAAPFAAGVVDTIENMH